MAGKFRDNPLGKGLSALLPSMNVDSLSKEHVQKEGPFVVCDIDAIKPNPYQPRVSFSNENLEGLAASIREKGVIQPLIVRKLDDGAFELIAGERRLRASKIAGLSKVPVLVREVSEAERLEIALIENVQREDLNPLEEAESYQKLLSEFGLNQEEIAKCVGKERSTIANSLRILRLPEFVKKDLWNNVLTAGHARALLSLDNEEDLLSARNEIVSKKMNVRQAEDLIRAIKKRKAVTPPKKCKPLGFSESQCESMARDISSWLGTASKIVQKGIRGKIEIEYKSPADLERLTNLIFLNKKSSQES